MSIKIIDWVNMPSGGYSTVMDTIKRQIGKGIAIVVLQKRSDKARKKCV